MKFVLPGYFFLASLLALHFFIFYEKKKINKSSQKINDGDEL